MKHNTVRGIFASADITKEDVKRNKIKSIDDILTYVIYNDTSPEETAAYRLDHDELAESKPSNDLNWSADVIVESPDKIHVSFTCKEYYTSSADDDFIDGSDYDDFAEFTEDQKRTLLDFLG